MPVTRPTKGLLRWSNRGLGVAFGAHLPEESLDDDGARAAALTRKTSKFQLPGAEMQELGGTLHKMGKSSTPPQEARPRIKLSTSETQVGQAAGTSEKSCIALLQAEILMSGCPA